MRCGLFNTPAVKLVQCRQYKSTLHQPSRKLKQPRPRLSPPPSTVYRIPQLFRLHTKFSRSGRANVEQNRRHYHRFGCPELLIRRQGHIPANLNLHGKQQFADLTYAVKSWGTGKSKIAESLVLTQLNSTSLVPKAAII